MIPSTLLNQLASLRGRERVLELAWGLARVVALALGLLLVGGAIDFWIDRYRDTPWGVRVAIAIVQIVLMAGGIFWWLVRPLLRSMPDDELALRVEDKHPDLHHRLISSIQLNRPGSYKEGMSPELIGVVTREAEEKASRLNFAAVADHGRLQRAGSVLLPMLLLAGLPFLWRADIVQALLARQFLNDEEVPRLVKLRDDSKKIWPQGEPITITVRADGAAADSTPAYITVGGRSTIAGTVPLEYSAVDAKTGQLLFTAIIPAAQADFDFTARLGDGRFKSPGRIQVVPRPVVTEQTAWLLLPDFCPPKPDGSPYEKLQPHGDVAGIFGSKVRLAAQIQKPVKKITLELLGTDDTEDAANKDEKLRRKIEIDPSSSGDGTQGEIVFELRPDESIYRIVAEDEHGFTNQPVPRRSLRVIPEDPPAVTLLPEQFLPNQLTSKEDDPDQYQFEGLPLIPGAPVQAAYTCFGPYGLGHANFLYRVIKKRESGNEDQPEEKWVRLPLAEVVATEESGQFNPRTGTFQNSLPQESVGFHAQLSAQPEQIMGRQFGGGRYIFHTKGIKDQDFKAVTLKEGDQVEFRLEVYPFKDREEKRKPGLSEIRVKNVVSTIDLARWMQDVLQEERRIRQLDQQQRAVFDGSK